MKADDKIVWLKTRNKEVLTTALESGFDTFLFTGVDENRLVAPWQSLARFKAILQHPDGQLEDLENNEMIGHVRKLKNASDLAAIEAEAAFSEITVMEASDWQIIPAENLVAAFQSHPDSTLMAVASSASDGQVMLTSLEKGTDGVVLETESPEEVRALATYLATLRQEAQQQLPLQRAKVISIRPVGMGDRACVDLCSNMVPGEGMLVGSFARGLFLVHSECAESSYINSRPFRVNAGPVHSYVSAPNGKTAYLSELKSGDEAMIVNSQGKQRRAVVGRVKIESRPLVLIQAQLIGDDNGNGGGDVQSIILQNAETVKLIGPLNSNGNEWRAIAVSEIKPNDEVYVLRQGAARHTGVAIDEQITER